MTGMDDPVIEGLDVYRVGGAVRDAYLGWPVSDTDWVVVGATPEAMRRRGFKPVGRDFPVFLHPETHEEYALARTERKSGRGYTGFTVHASAEVTLEEDLARRDLTINAMAETPDGRLVDPYGGLADLRARTLRHVSPAFVEDPLRVLRAARFLARYDHLGFTIADETRALMRQLARSGELEHLVAERVWTETEKALAEPSPAAYFRALHDCQALAALLPELADDERRLDTALGRLDRLPVMLEASDRRCWRWARLVEHLGDDAREAIAERLRLPRVYRDLARQVALTRWLWQATVIDADSVQRWLDDIDAWRRPERVSPLVSLLQREAPPHGMAVARGWAAARQVAPQPLLEAGYRGAALGEALTRERRVRLAEALEIA